MVVQKRTLQFSGQLWVERASSAGMLMQYGSHHVSSRTARWREGQPWHVLGWALREHNRSASRSEAVHQVTGHRVLRAKAHETVAACHSLRPAPRRSKAPYAARAGSPGHQQDHHHIASASPCLLPRTPRLNFLWQTHKVNLAARRHSESKDCPQLNHRLRASFSQQNFHPLRSHHVMPLLTKAFSLNTSHLQSSVNHPSWCHYPCLIPMSVHE